MLAYTYYPLEWEKVLFGDEVEIEMDTELLFNTSAVDGLIIFCYWKKDKSIRCSRFAVKIVSNNS